MIINIVMNIYNMQQVSLNHEKINGNNIYIYIFFFFCGVFTSARLLALVCIGVDYPTTPPCIAVMTEVKGQKEPRGIQTKVST